MLAIYLTLMAIALVVYLGFRILIGWFLPAGVVQKIDKGVDVAGTFLIKFAVVIVAVFIVWAVFFFKG